MTKKKNVKGYLAIEENGVEVWPKALVEAVYVACSEEMQRLKVVGTRKVVKMIPKCEHCRIGELLCKLKAGVRTDRMSCSNCSRQNHCSRPADYMWRTFGAMWTKEYAVSLNQFQAWYPKVMSPKSIYVIKDSDSGRTRKGGKIAKKKSKDRGDSPDSAEDEEENKDGDWDGDGDKANEKEEDDEQGNDQDPSPSTSRKRSQGSLPAASTPNRRPQSQKPTESPMYDLQLKVENTKLKQEVESLKARLWDGSVDGELYRPKDNTTLSVQTELESEIERLRTRLLEFEKIVGEFTEDVVEKQTGAQDIALFREGSAALYSVIEALQGQNDKFRQHLHRIMNDSLFLRLCLDVEGHPESRRLKDVKDKLHEIAVGLLNLPGSVWTTAEKERIEKIFNHAEGSSGTKRSGGDLEEEAESRRKRARMLLKGKSVGRLGSGST